METVTLNARRLLSEARLLSPKLGTPANGTSLSISRWTRRGGTPLVNVAVRTGVIACVLDLVWLAGVSESALRFMLLLLRWAPL